MKAFLSIDVEDFYHLEYFKGNINKTYSMLDGLSSFLDICEEENIPPNLFVLSDVVNIAKEQINRAISLGGEVGLHGKDHKRPLTLTKDKFIEDTIHAKKKIEDILGIEIKGYRAACFSLNRDYLNELIKIGFRYDSSYINFIEHPLYGYIDCSDMFANFFGIYSLKEFNEYEITINSGYPEEKNSCYWRWLLSPLSL